MRTLITTKDNFIELFESMEDDEIIEFTDDFGKTGFIVKTKRYNIGNRIELHAVSTSDDYYGSCSVNGSLGLRYSKEGDRHVSWIVLDRYTEDDAEYKYHGFGEKIKYSQNHEIVLSINKIVEEIKKRYV